MKIHIKQDGKTLCGIQDNLPFGRRTVRVSSVTCLDDKRATCKKCLKQAENRPRPPGAGVID